MSATPMNAQGANAQLIMVGLQMLAMMQQQQAGRKKGNQAARYIRDLYQIKPLEQGVKVKPPDDSGYWAALGYEA